MYIDNERDNKIYYYISVNVNIPVGTILKLLQVKNAQDVTNP